MTRRTPGSRERNLACRPISPGVGVSRTSTPASRYPSPASFSIRAITWLIFRPFRAASVLQDQEVAKLGLGEIHEPCANDHPQVANLAELVQQEGYERPPAERVDAREIPRRVKEHAVQLAFDDGQEGNSLGGRRQGREGPTEDGPSGFLERFRERRRRPDPVEGVSVEDPPPREKIPVPVQGDDPILDLLQDGHEVGRVGREGNEQGKGVLPVRPRGGKSDLPEPRRRLLEPGSVQGRFQDREVPGLVERREGPEEGGAPWLPPGDHQFGEGARVGLPAHLLQRRLVVETRGDEGGEDLRRGRSRNDPPQDGLDGLHLPAAEHEPDRLGAIAGGDGQQPYQGLRDVPAEGLLDSGDLRALPAAGFDELPIRGLPQGRGDRRQVGQGEDHLVLPAREELRPHRMQPRIQVEEVTHRGRATSSIVRPSTRAGLSRTGTGACSGRGTCRLRPTPPPPRSPFPATVRNGCAYRRPIVRARRG